MERASIVSTRAGLVLIAAVFAANTYRAATQSLTTDEAMTALRFVFPPWTEAWREYEANNHVLNSLLARMATMLLGQGEFALRLPSLLAGGAYLLGAWVLARRVFRAGRLFLAALGLMVLNPLVLDHLTACRGYGMALAGWIWGLLLVEDSLETGSVARMQAGAVALALAVCANLAFLFPVAAAALVFGCMVVRQRGPSGLAVFADRFAVPAAAVGLIVLLLPMQAAAPGHFYYGAKLLGGAVDETAKLSFLRERAGELWDEKNWLPIARILAGMALAAAAWAALRSLRRGTSREGDRFLVLGGGTAVAAFAAIVAAHRLAGMPYPLNRTALYWIPLLSVMSLAAVREIGWKPLTAAAVIVSAAIAGRYVQQTRLDRFGEWVADAGAKRAAAVLRREAGNRAVRVCTGHGRDLPLAYYRRRLGMAAWTIEGPGQRTGPCDWWLAATWDKPVTGRVAYRDAGLVLVEAGHP